MVRFRCGGCAQKIGVPDSYRGKRVKCPKCSRVASVPHEAPHGGQSYQVKQSPDILADPGAAQGSAWTATTGERRRHDSSGPAWIDYLRASKALVFVSFLITLFGTFWLLGELEVLPPLHWLWTLGLAATGVLSMVLGGINKQTLVIGPYLVICAGFSVLRWTGNISMRVEIPCLVVAFGTWLFVVIVMGYSLPDLLNDD